ncbi:MAG: hypothetical protein CO093_01540 [Alphaproteobacteria bacterium CG_4_9_14_3_um_filter_47_13]|nr:MAG: hypothetical protein CO093_01540 [Alphaproteobacteria bacterium CG_4_9_14_3_um_filter_47_13]
MSEFNTSLLREKFIIQNSTSSGMIDNEPIIALSNRMKLILTASNGAKETFIVRAQNMHSTVRFSAQIVKDFNDYGSLIDRARPFNWQKAWTAITKGYEQKWNPQRWVTIYHKGRVIFEDGEGQRHPFLDIIEQCDARNKNDYEQSIDIAKDAFKQAGRLVTINHDTNVALIMKISAKEGKCGIIVRGPNKITTFNLTALPKGGRGAKPSQCLTVAAAFLEGIQLAFLVGMSKQKLKFGLIDPLSEAAHKSEAASHKLGRLNTAIAQFENLLHVSYRPDRPQFSEMINEAEDFARKILAEEIEAKIASGEMNKDDWVV